MAALYGTRAVSENSLSDSLGLSFRCKKGADVPENWANYAKI
jgi:hypothetical protein